MFRTPTHALLGLCLVAGCRATPPHEDSLPGPASPATPLAGSEFPLTFLTLAGEELDLDLELQLGRPIAFVFWTPRCDACLREMPMLASTARNLDGRVLFLGVLSGPAGVVAPLDARGYVDRFELDFPQLIDHESRLETALESGNAPYYVVLDRDGRVAHRGRYMPDRWPEL